MIPGHGPPGPVIERMSIPDMKTLGRSKIIEMAREAAAETGTKMLPEDDSGVKVLVGPKAIKVILAKGYRAYDDNAATRRIETTLLVVLFEGLDGLGSIMHEGDMRLTERDQETLDLVLKNMPSDYEFVRLTIIDDPKEEPAQYIVQLSSEHTMGRHKVDRKTGEWIYVTHKHFARRPKDEWDELKE